MDLVSLQFNLSQGFSESPIKPVQDAGVLGELPGLSHDDHFGSYLHIMLLAHQRCC